MPACRPAAQKNILVRLSVLLLILLLTLTAAACTSASALAEQDRTDSTAPGAKPSPETEETPETGAEPAWTKAEPVEIASVYLRIGKTYSRDYYIPGTIEIVDPSGKYSLERTDIELKVRGNSTSYAEKKPFNVRFAEKTELFGLGSAKKWCLMANCFDKTLIRNKLAYDLASDVGMPYVSQSVFVDLYVGGAYYGNYLLCESVGVGKDRVNLDEQGNEFLLERIPSATGYDTGYSFVTPRYQLRFTLNGPTDPNEEQIAYLNEFISTFEDAVRYGQWSDVEEICDVDSFADFYVINELFKSVDFPSGSTRFYIKEGKIYAGPLWDMDLAMGNASEAYYHYNNLDSSGDSAEGFYCRSCWMDGLFRFRQFRVMVYQSLLRMQPQIVNLTTDNELGMNRIDRLVTMYGDSFARNYISKRDGGAGWQLTTVYSTLERIPDETYEENVEFLRSWLIRRNAWLLGILKEEKM